MTNSKTSTYRLVLSGLFIALFFLASNVLPPIYIVPSVPVTLQVLVVALMGGMLGLRWGLLSLAGLFAATAVGLPMMAGFSAGPAVFVGPTAGFIFGWVLLVVCAGAASDIMRRKRAAGTVHHTAYAALLFAAMILGVLLDYLCGAVGLAVYNGYGMGAVPSLFAANFIFILFDTVKCVMASALCVFFAFSPCGAPFAGSNSR